MSPYLLHHLLASTDDAPDRAAIVDGDRTHSYGAFRKAVDALAGRLVREGVARGDRVAILLPKSFNECVAIFAASRADAVFVPINPGLKPQQVLHIVRDSGARALVTLPDLAEGLDKDALGALPSLAIVLVGEEPDASEAPPPAATNIGEDLAAILYTSGSTGLPKGVMLSHRNLLAGARIVRTYLEIGPEDRILSLLPFSFDYGLNQLLTSVEQGAMLVLLSFQLGDEIVRALDRHRITGLAGVPTIWAFLTRAAPSLVRTKLPNLRYITNSGGAVPSNTVKRLRELLPSTRVFLMYGLTEAFRSTYLPPEELDRRPTSIGKAIPECEIFLVRADGERAKPGESGILVHRGPTVSLGYWNRPEDTARVLRPHPFRPAAVGGETVCYSGDLAMQDEDGFLYFVGRDDAMIKSAGFRISPTEVEEALMASGQFRHVAVIGLPDAWTGQRVHAVAVASTDGVDTAQVLKQASETLPAYMVPKQIEIVDALPMTPNGKVDYKRLVAERV
jgi:acyl-CoA ligase (AMP-forming) (exosortase A-associated)